MVNALTVGPVFGYKAFGKMLPIMNVFASIGVIVGPVLASRMFEKSGSFSGFFGVLVVCSAVIFLLYVVLTGKKSLEEMQKKF